MTLADASKKTEWLRDQLIDIPIWMKPAPAISGHYDSQAILYKVAQNTYNGKQRHLIHHFLSLLKREVIIVDFVVSNNNLADILTKGLAREMIAKT